MMKMMKRSVMSVMSVIVIMLSVFVTAPVTSFAAAPTEPVEVEKPVVTSFDIEDMVLDITEPGIGFRQDASSYVNYYVVHKVLTEHLFALDGQELISYPSEWNARALAKGEFISVLCAVAEMEGVKEFAPLFVFLDSQSEWNADEYTYPLTLGDDDYITYEEAVTVLRQFNYYLHEVIGVQEDRAEYVTCNQALKAVSARFPEWIPSVYIMTNYDNVNTILIPYVQDIFLDVAANLLEMPYQELLQRYESMPHFFAFGLDEVEGKHIVRMRRADVSAITQEEFNSALDKFEEFVRAEMVGAPEPAPEAPVAVEPVEGGELPAGVELDGNTLIVTVETGSDDPTIGSAICTFWVDLSKEAQMNWLLRSLQVLMGWQI